jgi:dimethylaniline monooxygenase (N-oxide forming)
MEWFFFNNEYNVSNVAIIGAGVSGLEVANILIEAGFKIKVFEKNQEIGGVWLCNYPNLHLQTPKSNFKIPNHEYSKSLKNIEYPNREEILNYLQDFSRKHNLQENINFNCEIKDMEYHGNKVSLIYFDSKEQKNHSESFDFVVFCPGNYSEPYIPEEYDLKREGNIVKDFKGKIFHSNEIRDYLQFKNKNVVFIGYSKSAVDLASNISNYTNNLTILTRHLTWPIPLYYFNISFLTPNFFHRRFINDFMFDQFSYSGSFHRFWHKNLNFIKRIFWRFYEIPIDNQYKLSKLNVKPKENLSMNYLHHRGFTTSYDFFEKIEKKMIEVKLGKIKSIKDKEIVSVSLDDNSQMDTIKNVDFIILCTGYKRNNFPFLKKFLENNDLSLYRFTLDYRIPNVAFVGNFTSSMSNLNVAVQALWLSKFLKKEISFSISDMKEDVKMNKQLFQNFIKRVEVKNPKLDSVSPIAFNDLLLDDMKIPKRRKILFDSLRRYRVEDYEDLFSK